MKIMTRKYVVKVQESQRKAVKEKSSDIYS